MCPLPLIASVCAALAVPASAQTVASVARRCSTATRWLTLLKQGEMVDSKRPLREHQNGGSRGSARAERGAVQLTTEHETLLT